MNDEKYQLTYKKTEDLPNGKVLIRLDFVQKMC